MKAVFLVVALFAVLAVAQPIRPHISETFEGEGYTHIVTANETIWGLGRWVIDEPKGHALEFWDFTHEHAHHSVHVLKRFDLGFEYGISFVHHPTPHRVCRKIAVKPPMPPAWHWVREAHFHGKHVFDGTTYDVWRHHIANIELQVAVSEHDASRPHYFIHRSPSVHRVVHFISWSTFQPNATWFNVPDLCKNATESDWAAEEPIGADASLGTCAIASSNARRIVTESNGFDAASLIASSFEKAGVSTPSSLRELQQGGNACTGEPKVGDVFFDGVPATSAAVMLANNEFAECSIQGGRCSIVEQRDFTGSCRRFC